MYEHRTTCFYASSRQMVKRQHKTFLNSSNVASLFYSFKTKRCAVKLEHYKHLHGKLFGIHIKLILKSASSKGLTSKIHLPQIIQPKSEFK